MNEMSSGRVCRRTRPRRGRICAIRRRALSTANFPGCSSITACWTKASNPKHPLAGAAALPVDFRRQSRRVFHGAHRRALPGRCAKGIATKSADGRSPLEQLANVLAETARLQTDQQACLVELRRELAQAGIEIIRPSMLGHKDAEWLEKHFIDNIFPVLTPLSIDPAHPFPFIPNLGFSIALQLARKSDNKTMTALLRLPTALKRFVRLPDKGKSVRFVTLEDAVSHAHRAALPGLYAARASAHSASSAILILKWRKRRRISSGSLKPR